MVTEARCEAVLLLIRSPNMGHVADNVPACAGDCIAASGGALAGIGGARNAGLPDFLPR